MPQDQSDESRAPEAISRRVCFRGAALAVGLGMPLLMTSRVQAEESKEEKAKKRDDAENAAEAKQRVSKERAAYQDEPKGKANFCATCKFFNPPAACQIVDGTVSPQGWCQLYEKKG